MTVQEKMHIHKYVYIYKQYVFQTVVKEHFLNLQTVSG